MKKLREYLRSWWAMPSTEEAGAAPRLWGVRPGDFGAPALAVPGAYLPGQVTVLHVRGLVPERYLAPGTVVDIPISTPPLCGVLTDATRADDAGYAVLRVGWGVDSSTRCTIPASAGVRLINPPWEEVVA